MHAWLAAMLPLYVAACWRVRDTAALWRQIERSQTYKPVDFRRRSIGRRRKHHFDLEWHVAARDG